MEIQINNMNLNDLESICSNLEKDFDDFWNYNILKNELQNPNSIYFVVKDKNNNILGFAGILKILDEADITNIVVKKDYRNKGIGTMLLKHLILEAKKQNLLTITLEVNEKNKNAILLYKKFKFEELGIRKKYYNNTDNAIIMTLNLKS
jgi:ribosomal-protein-alanine acetyltransferase